MAPRKAADKKVNSAKANEPSAAGNKRKAAAPLPLPAANVYVVMKSVGYAADGFHSSERPTNSIEGVYYSEDEAYAAAIPKIISVYEAYGDEQTELRSIATTKGLSLKKRMERITAAAVDIHEGEETSFNVYKGPLLPTEVVDEDRLFDDLKPTKPLQSDSWVKGAF